MKKVLALLALLVPLTLGVAIAHEKDSGLRYTCIAVLDQAEVRGPYTREPGPAMDWCAGMLAAYKHSPGVVAYVHYEVPPELLP